MGIPLWHPDEDKDKAVGRAARSSSRRLHRTETLSTIRPRIELDRRLQQRFSEKEDLLDQLEVTVSLLDQFLSRRAVLGLDSTAIPPFILEDLPVVLATAATLSPSSPPLSPPARQNIASDTSTIHDIVDRLLQMHPYSTRLHTIENNILTAHRRIQEQLASLGTSIEDLRRHPPPLAHSRTDL